MKTTSQKGIAHLGVLLLVLVVAVIALVGYKLEQSRTNTNSSTLSNTAATNTPQTIPTINNTSDLNTAETTLNNQNIDGDLNPSAYNSDVSSLQ